MSDNPYESPSPEPHKAIWRARFQWLFLRSLIVSPLMLYSFRPIVAILDGIDPKGDRIAVVAIKLVIVATAMLGFLSPGPLAIAWILSPRPRPETLNVQKGEVHI